MWSKVFVMVLTLASSLPLLCLAQQTPVKASKQEQKKQIQRQQDNKDFIAHRHRANMAFLKQRLATNNTNLTEAQKTELISFFESQYKESISLRNPQYADAVNFFEQIANSPNMAQNEKKAAITSYFEQNTPVAKAGAEQQRMERSAEMNSIRSFEIREEIQQANTPTANK